VAIADVELADAITRYASLACDGANEVSRSYTVPIAHAEKHSREVARPASGIGASRPRFTAVITAVRRTLCRAIGWTFRGSLNRPLRFDPFRGFVVAISLQHTQRGGGDLETIELGEQRLERHHFARREARL
jgi:hypothetical protein